MSAKPPLPFTLAFVAILLFELLGDTFSIRWLHYGCKPMIMALLLLYSWQHYKLADSPKHLRWLLVGMVFALLGDVFLMIQETDLFALGLGAFLVMQVCYIVAFGQSIRLAGQSLSTGLQWTVLVPFVLYSGLFLFFLRPAFSHNPALMPLWWPVVSYVICLTTMGIFATQRRGMPGAALVSIGAILFILSDSTIALDKFLYPFAGANWVVMSTYAAAQYLIVVGMIRQIVSAIQNQTMAASAPY